MAEFPFNSKTLETYKDFLRPKSRPNVLGTAAGRTAIEAERKGLESFLGTADYGQQLKEAQDLGKLQLGLALAQRGFAAAGATPQRGESTVSTLSRELLSPLAGDAGAVATQMMKQRQALKQAERAEDRQLKLSAFQNVQQREAQKYADELTNTKEARNLLSQVMKVTDEVSNDYIVGDKNVPLIVRKGYTGKLDGFYTLDGKKIDDALVKSTNTAAKPVTSWASNIQVMGPNKNWIDAPGALRIADPTGQNSKVVLDNVTLDFDEKSPTYNARVVAKKGSGTSAFYKPTTKSVFLSESAVELFGLDPKLVGQKVTYREYLVKPERRGPNSRPIKELVVGGKSFVFNQHSGYQPETGDITVQRGPDEDRITYNAEDLFRLEDPKAFTSAGKLIVPSDKGKLSKINLIPGLEGVTAGENLEIERNAQNQIQVRRGQIIIPLTDAENALFQTRPLSKVQQVASGQELEPRKQYVNTGNKSLTVGGQTIGPGQTGAFSKTDTNSPAFLNVVSFFREVGPVSTDAVTYMFKEPRTIDGVDYDPGDEIPLSPQVFFNLDADLRKGLTDDPKLRSQTVKKNFFQDLAKTVITQNPGLINRTLTKEELNGLLASFPSGMRSGGKNLSKEIFDILKLGKTANPNTNPTPALVSANNSVVSYKDSVKDQLDKARERYEKYQEMDVLGPVPWGTLSFEDKRAFADLPKILQPQNVSGLWEKSRVRLANDKKAIKSIPATDVAAFNSASELLILARYLDENHEIDQKTGVYTGFLGSLGASTFADISPISSGGSRRLRQIINRMKASYATLSATEGGGRDSVFRQSLQADLLPAFSTSTNMNRNNLKSIINRLDTNIRSSLGQGVKTSNVVPKTFEISAKEAGVTGVSVDQKRYRWMDPNEPETPAVTREKVMKSIGIDKFVFKDVENLRTGRLLPPAPNATGVRYVKIKNLGNGEVLIRKAKIDGKPDKSYPLLIMSSDMKTRKQ